LTAGSYDPERNLAFFGPAPTYDTGPLRDPVAQPGVTNEALYTNATIAINPDTGKLAWHFQHVPNDQWDFDVPSSAPISYAVNGTQYVAMTVGYGSAHALTFPMLTPEIDLPVVRSATIWVFALPKTANRSSGNR
jgi:glucose dehydrogenase